MNPNQYYNTPTECSSSASHSSIPSKSTPVQTVPFQVYTACLPAQTAYQFPNIMYQQPTQFNNNPNQQQSHQATGPAIVPQMAPFAPTAVYPYPQYYAAGYPAMIPAAVPVNMAPAQGFPVCMLQPGMSFQSTYVNYQGQQNSQSSKTEQNSNMSQLENFKNEHIKNPQNYLKIEGSQTTEIPVSSSMSIQNHLQENQINNANNNHGNDQIKTSEKSSKNKGNNCENSKRQRDSKNSLERKQQLKSSQIPNIQVFQIKEEVEIEEPAKVKKLKYQSNNPSRNASRNQEGKQHHQMKNLQNHQSKERNYSNISQLSSSCDQEHQTKLFSDNKQHQKHASYSNSQQIAHTSVMESQHSIGKEKISTKASLQKGNDNQCLNKMSKNQYLINDSSQSSPSVQHFKENSSSLIQFPPSKNNKKKISEERSKQNNSSSSKSKNKSEEKQQLKFERLINSARSDGMNSRESEKEIIQNYDKNEQLARFSEREDDGDDNIKQEESQRQLTNSKNLQEKAQMQSNLKEKEKIFQNQMTFSLNLHSPKKQIQENSLNQQEIQKLNGAEIYNSQPKIQNIQDLPSSSSSRTDRHFADQQFYTQFTKHSNNHPELENKYKQQNQPSQLLNQQQQHKQQQEQQLKNKHQQQHRHHYYLGRKNSSMSNTSCEFDCNTSHNSKASLESEPEISIDFDDIKSVDRDDNCNQQQSQNSNNNNINIPNILKEFTDSQPIKYKQQRSKSGATKSNLMSYNPYPFPSSLQQQKKRVRMGKQEKTNVEQLNKSTSQKQQNIPKEDEKKPNGDEQNNISKYDQSHSEVHDEIVNENENNESQISNNNDNHSDEMQEYMKKGNCVKNVIKAFQNWCKDEITDEVILSECPKYIQAGLSADQIRKKLNRYTKTKTPNHQNLQRLVEHEKFNTIFLYFLKSPAQLWITNSSIKDKSQHIQFIQLLIEKWNNQNFFDGFMKVLKRKKNLVTNKLLLNDKYYEHDPIS